MRATDPARRRASATAACRWRQRVVSGDAGRRRQRVLPGLMAGNTLDRRPSCREGDTSTTTEREFVVPYAKTYAIGGDLEVNRVGFGAMRLTGPLNQGMPEDPQNSIDVVRR